MPWVYRAAPPHVCDLPNQYAPFGQKPQVYPGSIFECDECGQHYEATDSLEEGFEWVAIESKSVEVVSDRSDPVATTSGRQEFPAELTQATWPGKGEVE